jgi:hypothetical protein
MSLLTLAPSVVLRLLTRVAAVDGRMRQRFASSRRVCRAHGWPRRRRVGTGYPISLQISAQRSCVTYTTSATAGSTRSRLRVSPIRARPTVSASDRGQRTLRARRCRGSVGLRRIAGSDRRSHARAPRRPGRLDPRRLRPDRRKHHVARQRGRRPHQEVVAKACRQSHRPSQNRLTRGPHRLTEGLRPCRLRRARS